MEKIFVTMGILMVLSFIAGIFAHDVSFTGKVVLEPRGYSYSTAICNENKCVDVLVNCSGNEVLSVEPVSDFVEFEESWIDERKQTKLCTQ